LTAKSTPADTSCPSGSITRTPIFPASSITPIICASWSADAPIICASLFEEAQQEAPGFAFVVRSMQVEFLKPARMDDVLEVTTAPEEVKGASITLHQRIARGEDLLVEAHVRVAFVCGGRARPIPKALRVAMRAGQGLIGS
jgi:YbgC/YbaW family acyl-CoA thioester hydrolase